MTHWRCTRRMLSNRESARRSRKRKLEQLGDLEIQVRRGRWWATLAAPRESTSGPAEPDPRPLVQIRELEDKQENLEAQCQQAAVHVQGLMADKQRLEADNAHLLTVLKHLQARPGEGLARRITVFAPTPHPPAPSELAGQRARQCGDRAAVLALARGAAAGGACSRGTARLKGQARGAGVRHAFCSPGRRRGGARRG